MPVHIEKHAPAPIFPGRLPTFARWTTELVAPASPERSSGEGKELIIGTVGQLDHGAGNRAKKGTNSIGSVE